MPRIGALGAISAPPPLPTRMCRVQACIFYMNNNDNGNGSAIYVSPRGSVLAIEDSIFKFNGYG